MNAVLFSLYMGLNIKVGDELTVFFADESKIQGVFIGGGPNCFQLNSKGNIHVVRKEVVNTVEQNLKRIDGPLFFDEIDRWRLSEMTALIPHDTSWSPTAIGTSAFVHPSIPYVVMGYSKEAHQIAWLDTIMLGGVGYGIWLEQNWGITLSFALTTLLIRNWVAKDTLYKLKTLRDKQNRLEQPNRSFCID